MTLVRVDDPVAVRDTRLLGLFEYWHGKLHDRPMPSRRDIDPIEMKSWLGNLILVEFPDDRMHYRVRLEGVNIVQFYGESRAGKGVEAMTSGEERDIVLPQYFLVLDRRQPAYYESDIVSSEGIRASQFKLLLPLSDDNEHVNMILVGLYFDEAA